MHRLEFIPYPWILDTTYGFWCVFGMIPMDYKCRLPHLILPQPTAYRHLSIVLYRSLQALLIHYQNLLFGDYAHFLFSFTAPFTLFMEEDL